MAMQTLHQDPQTRPRVHGAVDAIDHRAVRGVVADQTIAYAEEVRMLRQRVAALELELAASKVASAANGSGNPGQGSEFEPPTAPAVTAVVPGAPANAVATEPAERHSPDHAAANDAEVGAADSPPVDCPPVDTLPDAGFAKAWSSEDETSSFEERIAERAFFQATTVDQESRSWLLSN